MDWFYDTPIVRAVRELYKKEVTIKNLPEYKKKALAKQEAARKKRKKKQQHQKAIKRNRKK